MTTLFAALKMIQHLKQSPHFDDLMEEKNKYPEEFSMFQHENTYYFSLLLKK
jgi:predicted nucleotidyltransferase